MEFNVAFTKNELCDFLIRKGVEEDDAKRLQGKPDIFIFILASAKLSLSAKCLSSVFARGKIQECI